MFYQILTEDPEWNMHTLNSLALPPLRENVRYVRVTTKRNFRHSVNAAIPTQIDNSLPFIRFTPEQEIISFVIEVHRTGETQGGYYLLTVHIGPLLYLASFPYSTDLSNRSATIPWGGWGWRYTFFEDLKKPERWERFYDNFGQRQIISFSAYALIRDFNPRTIQYYRANRHMVDNSEVLTLFDEHRQCGDSHFAYPIITSLPFLQSEYNEQGSMGPSRVYLEQDYMAYCEDVRVHPLIESNLAKETAFLSPKLATPVTSSNCVVSSQMCKILIRELITLLSR